MSRIKKKRRILFVFAIGFVYWSFLCVKLISIQVLNHSEYLLKAKELHENLVTIKTKRGHILDRNGIRFTENVTGFSYLVQPNLITDKSKTASKLAEMGKGRESYLMKKLSAGKNFYLCRGIDINSAHLLRQNKIKGLNEEKQILRLYPLGTRAGQVVGYTNIDGIGISGLERVFNSRLKGEDGKYLIKKDGKQRLLKSIDQIVKPARDGEDIRLTLDSQIQAIVEEELTDMVEKSGATGGSALIIDSESGQILSMANSPQFNPNNAWKKSIKNRWNRTVTDIFEPGSTYKIVVLACALEYNIVSIDDLIFCENGKYRIHGHTIHDVHEMSTITVGEVFTHSSNIGIVKIGEKLGKRNLYRMSRAFGFGYPTGIQLPDEADGILRDPKTWSALSLPCLSFGQEVAVTALQLTMAYCAVANGGLLMSPSIILDEVSPVNILRGSNGKKPRIVRRVMKPETAETMTELMCEVVEDGTGKVARIEGLRVAGKTGTAQKLDRKTKEYSKGEFVSSFVGFLPDLKPRLVMFVMVDNPKAVYWGGKIAGPVFRRVMSRLVNLEGGPFDRGLMEQEKRSDFQLAYGRNNF